MTELTPKVGLPFPSENKDHYFLEIESNQLAIDSALFAAREDRNLVFLSEGIFTFSAISGLLTWSQAINILVPTTGRLLVIAAGSVSLQNGDVAYVNLVRGSTIGATLSVVRAAAVPSSDAAFMLAFRFGTKVYFNNGRVISDGEVGTVLSTSSLAGVVPTPPTIYVDAGAMVVTNAAKITAANTLVKASSASSLLAPCVGFVSSKPSAGQAIIQSSGDLGGFVGLLPSGRYFLGAAGTITLTPPSLPADLGSGKVIQRVGVARTATTLLILIDPLFVVL